MMNLASRLVGTHRLMLPALYPYLQRFMQPHQKEVATVLAAAVQV